MSRSDYGILSRLIEEFLNIKKFDVSLLITGNQFSKRHGNTHKEIIKLPKLNILKLNNEISIRKNSDVARYIAKSLAKVNEIFKKKKF